MNRVTHKQNRLRKLPEIGRCMAICGIMCVCNLGYGDSARSLSYLEYKSRAMNSLQIEFDRVVKPMEREAAVKEFRQRLALLDEVTVRIARRLRSVNLKYASQMLDGIVSLPSEKKLDVMKASYVDSRGLMEEYAGRFTSQLPTPSVDTAGLDVLRKYYNARFQTARDYIWQYCRVPSALDASGRTDIAELYLVLSFLHVPDHAWQVANIQELPVWLRQTWLLKPFEEYALAIERPCTALEFARFKRQSSWNRDKAIDYFLKNAELLSNATSYRQAIACAKAALSEANRAQSEEKCMKARFILAEASNNVGSPRLAASAMEEALRVHAQSPDWARAAMLRLKYLYKAKQYKSMIKDGLTYKQDDRSKTFLPQITYLLWVAARQEGQSNKAQDIQEEFIGQFPDNPLCADMYFAAAMTALAQGDYDEATRCLEIIEYRFADSRVSKKAKTIQEKLATGTSR